MPKNNFPFSIFHFPFFERNTCLYFNGIWKMENGKSRGFTLIEILVVIGIMSILLGLAIPAYNTFNQSNHLRQAGESLLQSLREIQNRAVSGKNAASCPNIPSASPGFATQYTYDGWYMQLTQNASTYSIAAYCGFEQSYASGTIKAQNNLPLKGQDVTINSITLNSSGAITPVYIVFKPVSQAVNFYNSTFPAGTPLPSDTKATIQLKRGTDTYNIVVTNSGAMYVQ